MKIPKAEYTRFWNEVLGSDWRVQDTFGPKDDEFYDLDKIFIVPEYHGVRGGSLRDTTTKHTLACDLTFDGRTVRDSEGSPMRRSAHHFVEEPVMGGLMLQLTPIYKCWLEAQPSANSEQEQT